MMVYIMLVTDDMVMIYMLDEAILRLVHMMARLIDFTIASWRSRKGKCSAEIHVPIRVEV